MAAGDGYLVVPNCTGVTSFGSPSNLQHDDGDQKEVRLA
jgi:hypothetical protein